MGTLRLFLALSVLVNHISLYFTSPTILTLRRLHTVTGGHAVFAFFIISGFYVSLIFNEKYAKISNGRYRFYVNRALRIYPVYLAALVITIAIDFKIDRPTVFLGGYFHPIGRWLVAVVTNSLIFGTELLPSINPANGNLNAVSPVWSLSIELYFYCLAPVIVQCRFAGLLSVTLAALMLRMSLVLSGVPLDPFRYYFFPSNAVFFLMGCVSYRIYVVIRTHAFARTGGWVAAALLVAYLGIWPLWYDLDGLDAWGFFVLLAMSIPFLFIATERSRIDRTLGNISYPVYMTQGIGFLLVVWAGAEKWIDPGVATLLVTLALAVTIHRVIEGPIEIIRCSVSRGTRIDTAAVEGHVCPSTSAF